MKTIFGFIALLLITSVSSANISVSCGTSVDEETGEVHGEVFSADAESWITGTSGNEFSLVVEGQVVLGAKAEGGSASGIKIEKTISQSLGQSVGYVLEIDAWEDFLTTGRKKTVGGVAGGLVQELKCAIIEM